MAMMMPLTVWLRHFDLVDASVDVVGLVLETLELSPWHAVEGVVLCRKDDSFCYASCFESQVQVGWWSMVVSVPCRLMCQWEGRKEGGCVEKERGTPKLVDGDLRLWCEVKPKERSDDEPFFFFFFCVRSSFQVPVDEKAMK